VTEHALLCCSHIPHLPFHALTTNTGSDLQCKETMFNSESFLTILKTSDNADELEAVIEKVDLEIARLRSRDTGDDDGLYPLT